MIRHYITIASRNFIKYKLQTLISVIGLAIDSSVSPMG